MLSKAFDSNSCLNEKSDMQGPIKNLFHQRGYCDFLLDPDRRAYYVAALNLATMMHNSDQADRFVQARQYVFGEGLQCRLVLRKISFKSGVFLYQFTCSFPKGSLFFGELA